LANIGYIQVVRHCNHFCVFCSNPSTPFVHNFESMTPLVDDFVKRGYFGVILTGGEPSLHPDLPRIAAYARDKGLHVRMITNGWRLAEEDFARDMAEAGLQHVHVSVYSLYPEVEEKLRGIPNTLERAYAAVDNAHKFGIEVNINCVISKLNAGHLHENIEYWLENHPHIRHFIWNNLDPSMGRAEVNQDEYTPRLSDFEVSLRRAMTLLHDSGRTFRVEKVPLCYMTDFAWASTETRKIVKGEERIVHFLDNKQTVRQTDWEHIYSESCTICSLRQICGGLFDQGNGYDPAELYPVFVSQDSIVERIIQDPMDPSYSLRTLEEWRGDFERRVEEQRAESGGREPGAHPAKKIESDLSVGFVTDQSTKKWETKRRAEGRMASRLGVAQEHTALSEVAEGPDPSN
jgi:MoaA/NifB/PqqE/SkfB family radical SAM enzyme